MRDNTEKKIEFLYTAINDTQQIINFIDTKTAFAVTIIGSIIVGLITTLETTIKYFIFYNFWLYITFFLLLVHLILSIWVITRIIKPTNNPFDNLKFDSNKKFKIKFFIAKNKYRVGFPFFNSNRHKLDENFNEYSNSIKKISNLELFDVLTLELFKVSFIRNIKNDRFNYLITLLIITTIIFFIHYLLYLSQTDKIKSILEHYCSNFIN